MDKYLITLIEPVGEKKHKEIENILKIHTYISFFGNDDPFRTDETRHYLVDLDEKTKEKLTPIATSIEQVSGENTLEQQINSNYKIFASERGDWFIAARKGKDKPTILYKGHILEDASEAILVDIDIPISIEKVNIIHGYKPKKEDFS